MSGGGLLIFPDSFLLFLDDSMLVHGKGSYTLFKKGMNHYENYRNYIKRCQMSGA